MPKGYEIPIVLSDPVRFPELGKLRRYAMCIAVNATWLAWWWAKKEKNEQALNQLRALILDWPMDFKLLTTHSPEEFEDSTAYYYSWLGRGIDPTLADMNPKLS